MHVFTSIRVQHFSKYKCFTTKYYNTTVHYQEVNINLENLNDYLGIQKFKFGELENKDKILEFISKQTVKFHSNKTRKHH